MQMNPSLTPSPPPLDCGKYRGHSKVFARSHNDPSAHRRTPPEGQSAPVRGMVFTFDLQSGNICSIWDIFRDLFIGKILPQLFAWHRATHRARVQRVKAAVINGYRRSAPARLGVSHRMFWFANIANLNLKRIGMTFCSFCTPLAKQA